MSDSDTGTTPVALASRAFRNGALVAASFIAGALCIVMGYAATVLVGGKLVDVINRYAP